MFTRLPHTLFTLLTIIHFQFGYCGRYTYNVSIDLHMDMEIIYIRILRVALHQLICFKWCEFHNRGLLGFYTTGDKTRIHLL